MTGIRLYDYWRSSAAYRVRIALNLKGLDYKAIPVDLLKQAHKSSEHLALQPQGLVPALEIDGLKLRQSLAIIEYLDETRGGVSLLPSDPGSRVEVRSLAYAIAMEIHPICNLSLVTYVSELIGGSDGAEGAKIDWMRRHIGSGLAAFETMLGSDEFCFGSAPTMADCCLVPQVFNAERWGADLSEMPKIRMIVERCAGIEAFAKAHPDVVGAP